MRYGLNLTKMKKKNGFYRKEKDKLEIGDKVLCISVGYAFKYIQES